MSQWIRVAVVASAAGCVSTLLLVFIWRWCHHKKRRNFVEPASLARMGSLQPGISRLHNPQLPIHHELDQGSKNKGNYYVFRGGVSEKRTLFNWADHPSMAVDAVENGWSRFAFTGSKSYMPSPSKRSAILGVCAAPGGDYIGRESEAEISWEVSQGSAEFMQKVRLNPGLKKSHQNNPSMTVASVIRTALPLPGPPLGNYAFPQEAYFEITILNSRRDDYESVGKSREGEKTKLLVQGNSNAKGNSEALVHVTSSNSHKINNVEEMKLARREGGKRESVMFSLGLTTGSSVLLRVPGSYPGSIGFNSNGSVYLDGN
ncbi:uncharacterized protein LOC133289322 [Gastrolobium bilobum]|uniref:uncharacterized protein LOC133289322 n=1 Tax=Gastrolobium bilobum TaxID=150636 RepID=UPI002AB0AD65|nr:uncharacterized protein LOC133289322 [Gastrolobium bilobum]